jgi:glycosyltransferase involved in cell wall biosynthesis
MKICLVNPTVLMKRPIAEIIDQIDNHDVSIFCPRKVGCKLDNSMHYSGLIKKAKIYTYPTFQFPFIKSEWPVPLPSFFFKAFKVFRENDIVHMWVYFYISSLWITFTKLFFPKKKFILTMDTVPGESFSAGKIMDMCFKTYHAIFGWFIFGLPDVITLYGSSLIPYARKAGAKQKKLRVIPTGVELSKYRGDYTDVRKEFNIGKKTQIILFVGLIIDRKGIDTILNTLERLSNLDFKMILVGDGPNRKKFEELSRKQGLSDKVIFAGFRRDVKNFYRSADIFFFPSRGEGLAGSIMEAMASGLPIVSSRIPCTTDLILENQTGFLCGTEDIDAFSTNLRTLIKQKDRRLLFGMRAKKVIKAYEWHDVLQKYLRLYCDLSEVETTCINYIKSGRNYQSRKAKSGSKCGPIKLCRLCDGDDFYQNLEVRS